MPPDFIRRGGANNGSPHATELKACGGVGAGSPPD